MAPPILIYIIFSNRHRYHNQRDIRLAASKVLHSSIAIVMGPTPPGTGVIAEATPNASS